MKNILVIGFCILFIPGVLVAQTPMEDQYLNIAINMLNRKDFKDAVDYCTKSIKERSTKKAHWVRGDAYWELGEYRNAVDDYHSAAIYYDKEPETQCLLYLYMGEGYIQLNDYQKAYIWLHASEKLDYPQNPNKKRLYQSLADVLLEEKNYKEAILYYTKAIEHTQVYRELSTAYEGRGHCYYMLNEYELARADLNKAVNYNSENDNAYVLRGLNLVSKYKYAEALADFTRSIELMLKQGNILTKKPILAVRLMDKGSCLHNLNRNLEAITALLESLQYNPDDYSAQTLLAKVYKSSKDFSNAKKHFTMSIGLAGNNDEKKAAFVNRAKLAMEIPEFGEALKDYNSAVLLDSNDRNNLSERGKILFYKKAYREAIRDFNRIIEITNLNLGNLNSWDSTKLYYAYTDRGITKGAMGDLAGMKKDLDQALKLNFNSFFNYRIVYYQVKVLKNRELANKLFDTLIKKDYDSCYIHSYAQAIMGNLEKAVSNQRRLITKHMEKGKDYFDLASVYAIAGKNTEALKYLDISLAANYQDYEKLWFDVYLEPLRKLPQWKSLMTKQKVPSPKW